MDADGGSLPDTVNPSTFPAKLWRLVHNVANTAIMWDQLGKTIVINQELFESQVLSTTSAPNLDQTGSFKTTNFCSFVRQLNLYGFKKISPVAGASSPHNNGTFHCFYHKNFNRNHPELVANLKRLTADNKAKLSAGLKVSHRPWSRRGETEEGKDKMKKHLLAHSPTLPYSPNTAPSGSVHVAAPVYPLYLMRSSIEGTALPQIPVSPKHHNTGAAACSNVIYVQQTVPGNHGSLNATSHDVCTAQNEPRFQYYLANAGSHTAGSDLQVRLLSTHHHNQSHVDHDRELMEKTFQIAEELMPFPTNSNIVKVENAEETF